MEDFDHELAAKQEEAVAYMMREESDGAALLAFDMGLGKTRTALLFARARGDRVVLAVIKHATIGSWQKAAATEYPELTVKVIDSSTEGKKAMAGFIWREPGIYLITHQYWERKAWRKELKRKRKKSDPDTYHKVDSGVWGGTGFLFVLDESHCSCNPDSWTFAALSNLNPSVFKLSMSGTPFGDGFDGAYGATKWLWPHRIDIIPNSIYRWREKWAKIKYHPFAPRNQEVVGELEEGAFVSALPCYIREESNMPDAIPHELWVDLYPEQRRVYDELDDRMVAWINENPLVAEYGITKRVRQRQTTLALPSLSFVIDPETGEETNELAEVYFEPDAMSVKTDMLFAGIDGRIPKLAEFLEDQPLLILTDSRAYATILTHRLNERYGDVAREWSGATAKTPGKTKRTKDRPHREGIKAEFIEGKIKYIVGVYAAMGTGTDELQFSDAQTVVSMSLPDYRISKDQGIARLNRTGQTKPIHHVMILARDTVDTGQVSKQMKDAIAAAKTLRKLERKRKREEERERKLYNH